MTDTAVSQPVVVGVDGSTSALHAVRWAASEAARRTTRLLIVHSYALAPVRAPLVVGLSSAYTDAVLEQGRQWLGTATEAAQEIAPQVARARVGAGAAASSRSRWRRPSLRKPLGTPVKLNAAASASPACGH